MWVVFIGLHPRKLTCPLARNHSKRKFQLPTYNHQFSRDMLVFRVVRRAMIRKLHDSPQGRTPSRFQHSACSTWKDLSKDRVTFGEGWRRMGGLTGRSDVIFYMGVEPKIGFFFPQNGWYIIYNGKPYEEMDDLGVPLFSETSIYIYISILGIISHQPMVSMFQWIKPSFPQRFGNSTTTILLSR